MKLDDGYLQVRLAESEADLNSAARLRYKVFIEELGGDGPLVDHTLKFERDAFDPFYDHMVLVDTRVSETSLDHVVGVYRLLSDERKTQEKFYTEDEFDLSVLKNSGRRLLELGRSCVNEAYRSGPALPLLWSGLADYVLEREIEILFGVASLHGTNIDALAQPLSHLYYSFLAPPELRVRALEDVYQKMDLFERNKVDRVTAMKAVPALIKSYLRLGGFVGDGAFVDRDFNTTDVCLVMDTSMINEAFGARFTNGRAL